MSKIECREFLICRHVDAQLKLIANELEGDLNKIICNEVEKLSFALKNLLDAAGIQSEFTSYVKIVEGTKIEVGKIIRINLDKDIDIEILIQTFLKRITQTDNISLPMFDQNLIEFDDIIENEANKFLLKNENKQIKQGLEVVSADFIFKMAGKFNRLEHKETSQGTAFSNNGTVNGLIKNSRTAYFMLNPNKIIYAYYKLDHFEQLHNLLKSDELNKFTFRMNCDLQGKKGLELISIQPAELADAYPLI